MPQRHESQSTEVSATADVTVFPMSFAQRRLWILDQVAPGRATYNVPMAWRVAGPLNVAALRRALSALVDRHEVLRTTFQLFDGEPSQIVRDAEPVPVPIVDLTALGDADREQMVLTIANAETRRPFDLATGPLLRACVIRERRDSHVVICTLHHIVTDGWSIGVIVRELAALYQDAVARRRSSLPPLRIQYADYSVWQRDVVGGTGREQDISYWKRQLDAAPPGVRFSGAPVRPSADHAAGANYRVVIDETISAAVYTLARQERATLFMVMLASLQALAWRYTGETDVVIGTEVAGRTNADTESLIGLFVNALALRTDVSGDPTFRELVQRARETAVGAFSHQDFPFEQVVDVVGAHRDGGRNPLFEIVLSVQNAPDVTLQVPELTFTALALAGGVAKFDLCFNVVERPRLQLTLQYRSDVFDEAFIEQLAGHFVELLTSAVTAPDRRLSAMNLWRPGEHARVRARSHGPSPVVQPFQCVHETVEAQAALRARAVAVQCGGHGLDFGELTGRANQLARYLQRRGAGPDARVAVCIPRSLDLVVALLAVLKSGAAYVALDPDYPAERLAFMVEDATATMLLTTSGVTPPDVPEACIVVSVDTDAKAIACEDDRALVTRVAGDNLAYVLYTSGSSGRPKGVMISHAALASHMSWMEGDYPLDPSDRVLQKTSVSFDASVWEFWAPLMQGATLVLARPGGHLDPAYLIEEIRRESITILQVVPSMLGVLLDHDSFGACRTLRRVFVGGEALSAELRDRFVAASDAALVNLYGPTEATIDAVAWTAERRSDSAVVIGRPVDHMSGYVLDGSMGLVPTSVPGELFLTGPQLARGYLGQPALTAARFVPCPFAAHPGERMYRTGDRVQWLPCDRLQFLGRADDQVKLRGFRIEPGEVESALASNDAVRQCAIIPIDVNGTVHLAAYVVATTPMDFDVSALRDHLRTMLPEYMVPTYWVPLESLPRLPNGKIDRRGLPRPDTSGGADGHLAPETDAERVLAEVWKSTLGVDDVSVDANFFELGGDSILSLQIVARAARHGVHLRAADIFRHQTIRDLARVATTQAAVGAEQGVVTGISELLPIQRRFFDRELPTPDHFNQAVMLRALQPLEPVWLRQVIEALMAHHDGLRSHFRFADGRWQQQLAATGMAAPFAVADVAADDPRAAIEAYAAAAQAQLNLHDGKVIRFDLLRAGNGERLLIVAHHLVIDGVSWRILVEDLQRGYEQASRGETIDFGPKTTSIKAWSEAVRARAQEPAVVAQAEYWIDRMARASRLDAAAPIGVGTAGRSGLTRARAELTAAETQSLLGAGAAAYGAHITEVLLAALLMVVHDVDGRAALLVELERHGRDDAIIPLDVSRTVGWFTSEYPVLLELHVGDDVGDTLKAVKEQMRSVPSRGLDYGLLQSFHPDADVRRALGALHPCVRFNYHGQVDQVVAQHRLFTAAAESAGPTTAALNPVDRDLTITGGVSGGRLRMNFHCVGPECDEELARLASAYADQLRAIADHCSDPAAGGYTPGDFPLATLDQRQLDAVLARVRFGDQ